MFVNVRDDSNSLRPLYLSRKEPGTSQVSDLKDICEVCGDNSLGLQVQQVHSSGDEELG